EPAQAARRRTVRTAMNCLLGAQEQLLSVARNDVAALEGWRNVVRYGQAEFDNRYRREYLTTERFHRFDQALVRLLELLELPGVGRVLGGILYVVRTPYRLLKGLFGRMRRRSEEHTSELQSLA